ncbi:MAG: GGDEF domain-containing protein [bacterium]
MNESNIMDNKELQALQQKFADLKKQFGEIEKAYDDLKTQLLQISNLYAMTSFIGKLQNFDELLEFIKNTFRDKIIVKHYSLWLFNGDRGHSEQLRLTSHFGFTNKQQNQTYSLNGESFLARVISSGQRIYLADLSESHEHLSDLCAKKTGSFLSLPLLAESERLLGVVNLYREKPDSFYEDEIEYISNIMAQFANALSKIILFEHTKKLSMRDELTNMFNRRYFNQRYERELQRAKRYQRALSIIMLDIDHFKIYNDLNGHLMGDKVLIQVAQTLENILRKADLFARFGGEEFIILLPEIGKDQARNVAEKLRRKIEKTNFSNEVSQPNGKITISLGLAVYPEDSTEAQELIKQADDALYQAKTLGRNCIAWHGMEDSRESDALLKNSTPSEYQTPNPKSQINLNDKSQ